MLPRDAFFAPSEIVRPDGAVGRINADIITPYPPGIPVLAPGEGDDTQALIARADRALLRAQQGNEPRRL